jgi:hypothetical protein
MVHHEEKHMSKIRVSKTALASTGEKEKRKEWPVVVYLWAFGLAILGYVIARIGLSGLPHPYHWMSGLIGGVAGVPLGWLWYRWRGDVI